MHYLLRSIWQWMKLSKFRDDWEKINRHNDTFANNIFPADKVSIGNGTYGVLNIYSYRNPEEHLSIGSYCSIASDVIFVLSGEHSHTSISTYPFGEKVFHDNKYVAKCKGPITVEDDVWIGVRCTILSGVKIGQGSIIGAGSIVSRDVPPYSIFVGNKVVKSRFNPNIVKELCKIDFSAFSETDVQEYKKYLDYDVDESNIDMIIQTFPQKEG